MSSPARRASWARYEKKRKGSLNRKIRERHRNSRRGIKKRGQCVECGDTKGTIWHHVDYDTGYSTVTEICHKCHRAKHPRAIPGTGKIL